MSNSMTASVIDVTPQLAKMWLENNKSNRSIREATVRAYAEDMASGGWQLNGEGIMFDASGNLINGQHRLSAIVRSNCTIPMLVLRNVSASIYDVGASRSPADILQLEGIDHRVASNWGVAVSNLHYAYQFGMKKLSISTTRSFIKKHYETLLDVYDVIPKAHAQDGRVQMKHAVFQLVAMYAIEYGIPRSIVKDFLEIVSTGFCFDKSKSAAIVVRNDWLSMDSTRRGASERVKLITIVEKGLWDFYQGKPRTLSYRNWNTPIFSKSALFSVRPQE